MHECAQAYTRLDTCSSTVQTAFINTWAGLGDALQVRKHLPHCLLAGEFGRGHRDGRPRRIDELAVRVQIQCHPCARLVQIL